MPWFRRGRGGRGERVGLVEERGCVGECVTWFWQRVFGLERIVD